MSNTSVVPTQSELFGFEGSPKRSKSERHLRIFWRMRPQHRFKRFNSFEFVKSQLYLIVLALAFSLPAVLTVLALTRLLDIVRNPPYNVDSAIFFAICGMLTLELAVGLAAGYELIGKKALLKQLPSFFVNFFGSVAVGVFTRGLERSYGRLIYIGGYMCCQWVAVFIWRINFVGLAIERKVDSSNTFSGSANIVAQERWSSLGRKILVHILLTTASLLLIDSGTYGISVCVQVARVYGDSFLVSFSLFALFSLFQFVFTLSLAKTSPMSQESIIDGVAKGTNVAFFTMFSVPLKLFRFMQVIRTPPYSFWPLLFVSQIMDKVIPRYLLVRHEQKMRRLATLSDTVSIHHGKKVIPDDSSDLSLPSTQFDTLGPRSCNTKVEPLRNGYSMVNVTNSLNDTPRIVLSSNISGSVETEGLTAGNQDVSSPLSGDFTESASQPRADIDVYASQIVEEASNSTTIALASNALNSTGAGNLCRSHSVIAKSVGITAVVNTLESAERKVWSTMPYDYTRRDYAISDYIALFVSLGLILASPSDFLVKPNASGASGFYEDGINLNLENSALVSASHSDLFKAVGRRGWRVISLTAISSVIFSFALEWALVVWEYFLAGSPLYNHVYELSVRSIMTTLLSIASIVFWIMAGSRGLFAYGPLNLEYGT